VPDIVTSWKRHSTKRRC